MSLLKKLLSPEEGAVVIGACGSRSGHEEKLFQLYFPAAVAKKLNALLQPILMAQYVQHSSLKSVLNDDKVTQYLRILTFREYDGLDIDQLAKDGFDLCDVMDRLDAVSKRAMSTFMDRFDEIFPLIKSGSVDSQPGCDTQLVSTIQIPSSSDEADAPELETISIEQFGFTQDSSGIDVFKLPYLLQIQGQSELLTISLSAYLLLVSDIDGNRFGRIKADVDFARAFLMFERLFGKTEQLMDNILLMVTRFGEGSLVKVVDDRELLILTNILKNFLIVVMILIDSPRCDLPKMEKQERALRIWKLFKREVLPICVEPASYDEAIRVFNHAFKLLSPDDRLAPLEEHTLYEDLEMLCNKFYPFPHPANASLVAVKAEYIHSHLRSRGVIDIDSVLSMTSEYGVISRMALGVIGQHKMLCRQRDLCLESQIGVSVAAEIDVGQRASGEEVVPDEIALPVVSTEALAVSHGLLIAVGEAQILHLYADCLEGLKECKTQEAMIPVKLAYAGNLLVVFEYILENCTSFLETVNGAPSGGRFNELIGNLCQYLANIFGMAVRSFSLMSVAPVPSESSSMRSSDVEKCRFRSLTLEQKLSVLNAHKDLVDVLMRILTESQSIFRGTKTPISVKTDLNIERVRMSAKRGGEDPQAIVTLKTPVAIETYFFQRVSFHSQEQKQIGGYVEELSSKLTANAEQMARFEALLAEEEAKYEAKMAEIREQERTEREDFFAALKADALMQEAEARAAELASGYHDQALDVLHPTPDFANPTNKELFDSNISLGQAAVAKFQVLNSEVSLEEALPHLYLAEQYFAIAYQLVIYQNSFSYTPTQLHHSDAIQQWQQPPDQITKVKECELYIYMLDIERLKGGWHRVNALTSASFNKSSEWLDQLKRHAALIKSSPLLVVILENIKLIEGSLKEAKEKFVRRVAKLKKELEESNRSAQIAYSRPGFVHKRTGARSRYTDRRNLIETQLLPQAQQIEISARNAYTHACETKALLNGEEYIPEVEGDEGVAEVEIEEAAVAASYDAVPAVADGAAATASSSSAKSKKKKKKKGRGAKRK